MKTNKQITWEAKSKMYNRIFDTFGDCDVLNEDSIKKAIKRLFRELSKIKDELEDERK